MTSKSYRTHGVHVIGNSVVIAQPSQVVAHCVFTPCTTQKSPVVVVVCTNMHSYNASVSQVQPGPSEGVPLSDVVLSLATPSDMT